MLMTTVAVLALTACGGSDPNETKAIKDAVGTDPLLLRGQSIFTANCSRCHGTNGQGLSGPSLHDDSTITRFPIAEDRVTWVKNGSGAMPGFDDTLSDEEIDTVLTFVVDVLGKI